MVFKGVIIVIATYVCAGAAASVSQACMCVRNYRPVCGTDGKTYNNECMLNCARVEKRNLEVAREGRCVSDEQSPGCICTLEYNPVCGSDGNTYPNRCSLGCERSVALRHEGACTQKREVTPSCVCTREMKEVCGSDGKTYGNPCMLNCATIDKPSLSIRHVGHCSEVNVVERSEEQTPTCACTRNLRPVCGSDGDTYNNECLLRCSGKDVTLVHDGPC